MRDFTAEIKSRDGEEKTKKLGFGSKSFLKKKSKGNCRELILKSKEEDAEQPREKQMKTETVELSEENEFLVEDYESENERLDGGKSKRKGCGSCLSSSSDDDDEDGLKDEEEEEDLKVYFCSRTHSQLSQFVKELRRTVFASQLKVVSLGSRRNLCINEEVLKLRNSTRINERCLELQKNKKSDVSKIKIENDGGRIRRTKVSAGCPMLRKHKLQKQFRSEASQQGALDIEDLAHLGNRIDLCFS